MKAEKATVLLIDNGKVDVGAARQTLEGGGIECVTSDREEALFHVYASRPDLLVLASPGNECLAILTAFEVMSKAPTLALVPQLNSAAAEWAREMKVDAWLEIDDGPALLEQVARLLA